MKNLAAIGMGLLLVVVGMAPASAHSLKSLEKQLHKREKYFQPLHKKYGDVFLYTDVPEAEREEVAGQVADKILA